jgi:hypothetical protein
MPFWFSTTMERAFELARGADMGQLFDHIDTMADFDANYRAPDSKQTLLHLVSPRRHAV